VASGKSTFQNASGDFGAGFAGEVAEDGDAAALGLDDGAFFGGELVDGVIAAFDVDIGLGGLQEVCGAEFVEDVNGINGFECGDDGGAVGLGVDGAVGAFELGDGAVAVEAHDEGFGFVAGGLEVVDVAGVQNIEAAVGGGEGAALGTKGIAPGG
jgi:hypothetical protein